MPDIRDGIVTVNWMKGILWKTHWCLISEEAGVPKVCAKPPCRKVLARIVANVMIAVAANDVYKSLGLKATAALVAKNPPCVPWMLAVMSTLSPEHDIFDRNYQPPKVDSSGSTITVPLIADPYGFFSNLPIAAFKGKRCLNLLDPAVKNQLKLERLNARL